jgi:AcrR family transcriptional regulator
MIDMAGESSVKLDEVLAATRASVSSLYHYFGSLRGLIEEAQFTRFSMARYLDVDQLNAGLIRVQTKAEFFTFLTAVIQGMLSKSRDFNRMRRVTALASSESSDSMRQRLVQMEKETLEFAVSLMTAAQTRGFISKTIDVRLATTWASTVAFSQVLIDIVEDDELQKQWEDQAAKSILQAFGLAKA